MRLLREVTGQRTPDDRKIDVAIRNRVDDTGGRIVLAVVAVERETFDVVDDVAASERVCRWRVAEIIADDLHTDAKFLEQRIVKRAHVEMAVFARQEDIRGSIIWLRSQSHFEPRRHTDHDVAHTCSQRIAKETASLSPPGVLDAIAHVLGQQLRDLVFKTLPALIRKREIVRIGTDAKHAGRTSELRYCCNSFGFVSFAPNSNDHKKDFSRKDAKEQRKTWISLRLC